MGDSLGGCSKITLIIYFNDFSDTDVVDFFLNERGKGLACILHKSKGLLCH